LELRGHADTGAYRFPDIHSPADCYEDSRDVSYVDTSGSVSVTFDYASGSHTDSVGGTDGYAGAYRYSSADADSYGCSHRGTEFNTGSHRDTVS